MLDLGIWYSLSCGVAIERTEKGRAIDRIVQCVMDRWNHWNSWPRLRNIFETKQRILQIVKEKQGSNEYTLPRSNTSHVHEGASYLPEPKPLPVIEESDESGESDESDESDEDDVCDNEEGSDDDDDDDEEEEEEDDDDDDDDEEEEEEDEEDEEDEEEDEEENEESEEEVRKEREVRKVREVRRRK